MTSSGRTSRRAPSMRVTVTRWSPIGFGRSGERVAKTPVSGLRGSLRGRYFEHVALPLVEPREHENVVSRLDAVEPAQEFRVDVDRGVGRAFVALTRRILSIRQRRPHDADRPQHILDHSCYGCYAAKC